MKQITGLLSVFCVLILMCLPSISGFAQYNNFKNYSIEEGLPQSNVYCVLQDMNGYLWIGTDGGGACKFNGKSFETINSKKGLAGDIVRAIYQDSRGIIWFGTNEGITYYDGFTYKSITEKNNGYSGSTTLSFTEDKKGDIWCTTDDQGLNKIHFNSLDSISLFNFNQENDLSSIAIFDAYTAPDSNIWLATLYGGIDVVKSIDDSTLKVNALRAGSEIPSDLILCLEPDGRGNLWCGTYDVGAFLIKNIEKTSGWEIEYVQQLSSGSVWDIEVGKDGDVWFGTGESGVVRRKAKKYGEKEHDIVAYTMNEGMASNQILAIEKDQEDHIWFGTNGDGLVRYSGDIFSHFSEADGLSSNKVSGILQDSNGGYWLGTDGGGVDLFEFQNGVPKVSSIGTDQGLSSDYISGIAMGFTQANPYLWIGTTNNGFDKFDGISFTSYTEREGLNSDRVHAIHVDSRGVVWIGTASSISKLNEGSFINVKMSDLQIADEGVNVILEDRNHNMWFGTSGALVKYSGESKITTYDEVEGLGHKDVNAMVEGPNGNIWLGTNGGGLYKYDVHAPDSVAISFVADDSILTSNKINSLVFFDRYTLIVGTDNGFDKIDINDYGQIRNVRNYNSTDGFVGVECNHNSVFQDRKGDIWFGTGKGLTRYSPNEELESNEEPVINITDIRLFFKDVDWSAQSDSVNPWFGLPLNLELPYDKNHLTFYFAGISLGNPDKVKYRFMLDGRDHDWSPAEKDDKMTYSGLSAGEYTFKVIATNAKGIWNKQPASFHFIINPPWYQTTWFYASCLIVLIASIYSFIKARERAHIEEKRILEVTVKERTAEVVNQKEEIEEKSKEIMDSINYAKGIQDSIFPPKDRMKRHLAESFVLFKPKDVVSGDFYWMQARHGKVFFTAADCTGHGVPGAFVSMVGANGLNRSVNEYGLKEPAQILEKLTDIVEETFEKRKDGMDIALCAVNFDKMILEFAGANNPLWLIREKGSALLVDGEEILPNIENDNSALFEVKANKQPVGSFEFREPFINHIISLEKGDSLYVFSDGYPDQFGGPKGKKFKSKAMKKLLLDVQDRTMEDQEQVMDHLIEKWMKEGKMDQIDDICVFGVKI